MIRKRQVRAEFNRGAKTYEKAASLQSEVALHLADSLTFQDAKKVLEIGCGTGLLTRHLHSKFPQAELTLVDMAPEMLSRCQEQLSKVANVKWLCEDAETLILPERYDLIISSMTLHWFLDPIAGLIKLKSYLPKKGRFIFAMVGKKSLEEWKKICDDFNVTPGTPLFPDSQILQKACDDFTFHSKQMTQQFSCLYNFLKSFKLLGANAPAKNHLAFSPGLLRKMFRANPGPFEISYEIIYGEYQAP